MAATEGALALALDFGQAQAAGGQPGRPAIRLARLPNVLRGPDKYRVLEHRRRQAQIKARRILEAGI